jgi:hypothetical protein
LKKKGGREMEKIKQTDEQTNKQNKTPQDNEQSNCLLKV